MTGDGIHAIFNDPVDAINATLALRALRDPAATDGFPLQVRCGLIWASRPPRQRCLRRCGQPGGPRHGCGAWRPGALSRGFRSRPRPVAEGRLLQDLGQVRLRDLRNVDMSASCCIRAAPNFRYIARVRQQSSREVTSFDGRGEASGDASSKARAC
jgi:hypothetical protein